MMFFRKRVFGFGAFVVGLQSLGRDSERGVARAYLLGSKAPSPRGEYLMVRSLASLASRLAT